MSTQETRLAEIAEAIRTKENSSAPIPAKEFASRILALENSSVPEGLRTISLTAESAEGGVVSGGGLVSEGMTVTVNAEPGNAYNFNGWQENGQTVSESEAYTFTVTGDRALEAVFEEVPQGRLPKGYIEVEYIHSDSNCWINTGIKFDLGLDKLEMELNPGERVSTNEVIIGSTTQSAPRCLLYRYSSTTLKRIWAKGATASTNLSITGERATLSISDGTLKYGETTIATISVSMTTAGYVSLLMDAGFSSSIQADVYSCKMWEGDVLARDFVPCINPDGAVGLYDLVEDVFYANAGTSTFTAGPKV